MIKNSLEALQIYEMEFDESHPITSLGSNCHIVNYILWNCLNIELRSSSIWSQLEKNGQVIENICLQRSNREGNWIANTA